MPVDLLDLDAVSAALRDGPSVLWAETPTNPLLRVADLTALAAVAAAAGAPFVVDNTVATGLLQKPLDFGATASVYSLTKSVSGHSDVLGGAVVTRDDALASAVLAWRTDGGAIPGPFESWLVLRGLKTLDLRITRASANALAVATFLAAHPRVTAVHYPGLAPSAAAVKQMPRGFGPLLSFEVSGTAADADAVVGAARLIVPATSFGGVESSWERRARWPAETAPDSLIRMSCGVEPLDDLLADLSAALAIRPSNTSSSRTRWPLPTPPIDGLHDICPASSARNVSRPTRAPRRAAAAAASHPAWPAPITRTSYTTRRLHDRRFT